MRNFKLFVVIEVHLKPRTNLIFQLRKLQRIETKKIKKSVLFFWLKKKSLFSRLNYLFVYFNGIACAKGASRQERLNDFLF